MDIAELNKWIETDEGKQWADGLKAPLIAKRDELLGTVRSLNEKVAQASQREADVSKLLGEERAAVEKTVVDGELARILKEQHVFEPCIPGVIQELKQAYGLQVSADGANRTAQGKIKNADGSEKVVGLDEVVKTWSLTEPAKAVTAACGSGGGAPGSGPYSRFPSTPSLSSMSGRDLARMSDSDFQNALNNARKGV